MQNAECKIVVPLRDKFKNIAEGDTFILHFAFYILHSIVTMSL